MASMDISKLSFAELSALAKSVSEAVSLRKDEELTKFTAAVEALAEKSGIKYETWLSIQIVKRQGVRRVNKSSTPGASKSGSKVPAKYRDGENTWSGRGKQPNWLTAQISAGRDIKDFLI